MNERELIIRLASFKVACQSTDSTDFLKVLRTLVNKQKEKENDNKNICEVHSSVVHRFCNHRMHVPSGHRLERRNSGRE